MVIITGATHLRNWAVGCLIIGILLFIVIKGTERIE
jgi:hypothetical protein